MSKATGLHLDSRPGLPVPEKVSVEGLPRGRPGAVPGKAQQSSMPMSALQRLDCCPRRPHNRHQLQLLQGTQLLDWLPA